MERVFDQLVRNSRRIGQEEYARTFGHLPDEVVGMVGAPIAEEVTEDVRRKMETAPALPWGAPRLRKIPFGEFDAAPELARGEVAAVDGRPVLPLQSYSSGQALCVGVGSLSHRRRDMDRLHYWSSHVLLEAARSVEEFVRRQSEGTFGISQTAYMRYYEVLHALEIDEPIVLLDGTLVYQWLLATGEGERLYLDLFDSSKRCLGVVKSLKENVWFSLYARALQQGEVYVVESLRDHLGKSQAPEKNHGEGPALYSRRRFFDEVAPNVWRGVFRPRDRVFGFEVHERDLEVLLPILAADCQMNHVGHEIPFLLNRVDEQVRYHFRSQPLVKQIETELAELGEREYFRETHEREHR